MPTLLPFFFFFAAGPLAPRAAGTAGDPVFTTYAAPLHRSEYMVDQGYHLRFYSAPEPLAFTTDTAGDWGLSFRLGPQAAHAVGEYAQPPRIETSLSSLARLSFQPFAGLDTKATFAVWSSRVAILDLAITNASGRPALGAVTIWYRHPEGARARIEPAPRGIAFLHTEPPEKLSETPPASFTGRFRDRLAADPRPVAVDIAGSEATLRLALDLAPRATDRFRIVRAVAREEDPTKKLESAVKKALVQHLTNPAAFWRRFGVPTLAADDPGYQPVIRRCCQWNGAVWLEWNYLVFDGLRRNGYQREARELGERMIAAAATQLRKNHRFWESYSPDEETLASPMNYIWDSLLARVILDLEEDR